MVAIKKPIKKIKPKSEINKVNEPKPFVSEEETSDEVKSDLGVQEKEFETEATPDIQEQQTQQEEPKVKDNHEQHFEQLESEETESSEQQSQPKNPQTEVQLPKRPPISKPKLEPEEVVLASIEVEMKRPSWHINKRPIVPKQKVGFVEKGGAATVVNDRNSKRTKLKNVVLEGLGYPDYIKFYVTDEEFVVQASTADEEDSYKLRLEGKRKCIIYNSEVIELLTEMFDLDFTKSTSQTFGEVKFETIEDVNYAVIFKKA